jgi:hypothetical protein
MKNSIGFEKISPLQAIRRGRIDLFIIPAVIFFA